MGKLHYNAGAFLILPGMDQTYEVNFEAYHCYTSKDNMVIIIFNYHTCRGKLVYIYR